MLLPRFAVDDIITTALKEDIHYLDTTTDLMIPADSRSTARFLAKAEGVVCGMEIAMRVFTLLDDSFTCRVYVQDGDPVKPGDVLAECEGSTRFLLKGERTALNLLQHLSGIASATNRAVKLVEGTRRHHHRHPENPAGTSCAAKIRGHGGRRQKPSVQPLGRRDAQG